MEKSRYIVIIVIQNLWTLKSIYLQVLVCSDQMARGMDVEGVSCVVNYDPPRQYQTYLHRAGRTARAGQRGVVFTLLSREEVSLNIIMQINACTMSRHVHNYWLWLTDSLFQYNVEEGWCRSEAAWGSDHLIDRSQTLSLSVPTSAGKLKTPTKLTKIL